MIKDEKIKSVKKRLKNGEPTGEIREELIAEGYSTEDIEKCFTVHKANMQSWFLFFGIVFFLIGFYTFYYSGSLLFFVFAAVMFAQYYLSKRKEKNIPREN